MFGVAHGFQGKFDGDVGPVVELAAAVAVPLGRPEACWATVASAAVAFSPSRAPTVLADFFMSRTSFSAALRRELSSGSYCEMRSLSRPAASLSLSPRRP